MVCLVRSSAKCMQPEAVTSNLPLEGVSVNQAQRCSVPDGHAPVESGWLSSAPGTAHGKVFGTYQTKPALMGRE